MKKLMIYMTRWQLSTPVLALVPIALTSFFSINNFWITAFVSNLIGSLMFFWIDKKIFK